MKLALKVVWAAVCVVICAFILIGATAGQLPSQITDAEFWRMVNEFSEPNAAYPYENYVGNEVMLQRIIPAARKMTKLGGVYVGVGPEQNFTYATALEAKLAFVVDIRRQNMLELLAYKALFEMADNRADFVSLLFSRRRPQNLNAQTSASALFSAYHDVKADADYQRETLKTIKSILVKHGFKLSSADLKTIDRVHEVFYRAGPGIDYAFASSQLPPSPPIGFPPFERMMTATDGDCGYPCLTAYSLPPAPGRNWSFLATEENYRYIRSMQRKNLFIPLVGDFAGSSTIRKIGQYLKEHGATVSTFYASNVEYYLNNQQQQAFYANVLALPLDPASVFLRFISGTGPAMPWWNPRIGNTSVVSPIADLHTARTDGRLPSYVELLGLTKNPDTIARAAETPR